MKSIKKPNKAKIQEALKAAGWNQALLAKACGVHESMVAKVISGVAVADHIVKKIEAVTGKNRLEFGL